MSMNMSNGKLVYWHKNQLAITFPANDPILAKATTSPSPAELSSEVYQHLSELNTNALKGTPFTLAPFTKKSNQLPQQQEVETAPTVIDSSEELDGVYQFTLPSRAIDGGEEAYILAFCQIQSRPENMKDGMPGMGNDDTQDNTLAVIDQLSNHTSAKPHWLWSGTDDIIHGCPISPPIPVDEADASGRWKITLPDLSNAPLQGNTGKGVTVFVLDTLPPVEQIKEAATCAGSNNMLLQEMVERVKFNSNDAMWDILKNPNLESARIATGKDVYGKLVGFPMADHGLFIAGIIHDLVPDANIECIRVLNDFGVSDTKTLIDALIEIEKRIVSEDLQNTHVVINLSLVVFPHATADIPIPEGMTQEAVAKIMEVAMPASKTDLYVHIQSLAERGAIFVASVGNDSDPRDKDMNPSGLHLESRYPARFADDFPAATKIIPVGAVNGQGKAASYSNNPGPHGIATYGGETPTVKPPVRPQDNLDAVTVVPPVDALCGVYTAREYPALVVDDKIELPSPQDYPMHPRPNDHAWAYWSGTSFATPIITALVARLLQDIPPNVASVDVRQQIISAATQHTLLAEVGPDEKGENWPVIMAVQNWQPNKS